MAFVGKLTVDPTSVLKSICVQDRNISHVRASSVCIRRCVRRENEDFVTHDLWATNDFVVELLSKKGIICVTSIRCCPPLGISPTRLSFLSFSGRILL